MPKRAFTLIELLVVIAIIGILASIIMASLTTSRAKGRDAKRIADLKSIQLGLEEYYTNNLMYPIDIYAGAGTPPNDGLAPAYMPSVPLDPLGTGQVDNGQYYYTALTSNNSTDCALNKPAKYHLGATLEIAGNDGVGIFSQDADASPNVTSACLGSAPSTDFTGRAIGCGGTQVAVGASESCYDVVNQ